MAYKNKWVRIISRFPTAYAYYVLIILPAKVFETLDHLEARKTFIWRKKYKSSRLTNNMKAEADTANAEAILNGTHHLVLSKGLLTSNAWYPEVVYLDMVLIIITGKHNEHHLVLSKGLLTSSAWYPEVVLISLISTGKYSKHHLVSGPGTSRQWNIQCIPPATKTKASTVQEEHQHDQGPSYKTINLFAVTDIAIRYLSCSHIEACRVWPGTELQTINLFCCNWYCH